MKQDNPLLHDWQGPWAVPPFETVRPEHFEPAFEIAMKRFSWVLVERMERGQEDAIAHRDSASHSSGASFWASFSFGSISRYRRSANRENAIALDFSIALQLPSVSTKRILSSTRYIDKEGRPTLQLISPFQGVDFYGNYSFRYLRRRSFTFGLSRMIPSPGRSRAVH